ncbi:MAG TPA: hypothetical protein VH143_02210 [Kofleriaceae bacterium]|jgi:hypothetical protein|nr:hypothetical protein [Kofleriaceae bacterium]
MRAAGLALLAATTCNCNAIFNIGQSQPWDARLPIDAADYPAAITWQTYEGSAVTFDPIDGLTVKIGSLDGTVTPMAVAVDPTTGSFKIPNALGQKPTRVLFTAPDGVPTEIQSSLQGFTYAFPSFGRHGAARMAAGGAATFSGSATGVPAYTQERLATTGLWAVEDASPVQSGGSFAFAYGSADSLSGPLGVPQASLGDREIVLYMASGADDVGFATCSAEGLSSPVSCAFDTAPTVTFTPDPTQTANAGARVGNAVGLGGSPMPLFWAGVIPTTKMPGFAQPLGAATGPAGAPPPVLLPLDENNTNGAGMFSFQNPFDGMHAPPQLQLAVYSSSYSTRTADVNGMNVVLATALQGIALSTGSAAATNEDVGLAESNTSSPVTLDGSALVADATLVSLGGEAMLKLSFGVDKPVDDCTATLFKIDNGTFVPVVRYIVMAPPATTSPIMIDTGYLDTTSTFTFGVVCELGHSAAALASNDYTVPSYPFSMSSTFMPTFTVK